MAAKQRVSNEEFALWDVVVKIRNAKMKNSKQKRDPLVSNVSRHHYVAGFSFLER